MYKNIWHVRKMRDFDTVDARYNAARFNAIVFWSLQANFIEIPLDLTRFFGRSLESRYIERRLYILKVVVTFIQFTVA